MSNELVKVAQRQTALADILSDEASFELGKSIAKIYSMSDLIPAHFQGKPANCLIALQIARRLGEDVLTVMRNLYIVSGRLGWLTAYKVAQANRSGVFKGRIWWDETGKDENLAVTAKAVMADTGEEVSATCDMRMATAEGWTKNTKYRSMPAHMLKWRSASMLISLYVPEVLLGLPSTDELDGLPPIRDVTPQAKQAVAQTLDDFAGSIEHVIGGNGNDGQSGQTATPHPEEETAP